MNKPELYDSDLNSEREVEKWQSDAEPPTEHVNDKKALKKEKDLKIYKQLYIVGEGIARPARYDLVSIKLLQIQQDEITGFDTSRLDSLETLKFNIGRHEYGDWMNTALENLRKGEISLITLKHIGKDPATKSKTQSYVYWVIHLMDWITMIDLDEDGNFIKTVIQKGSGNFRWELNDEVTFSYKLFQGEILLLAEDKTDYMIQDDDGIPTNVIKVMKTMKVGECTECSVKHNAFLSLEKKFKTENLVSEGFDFKVWVDIKAFIKIEDLFDDRTSLKLVVKRGTHTAKPEKMSEIFYNYEIYDYVTGSKIFSTPGFGFEPSHDEYKDLEFLKKSGKCQYLYLDEFSISKPLKRALKLIKKLEVAEMRILNTKHLTYGQDYEEVKKAYPNLENVKLKYIIEVYNFSEGKNSFTMTIDEKIFHAKRKREIALLKLKEGNVKKALKIFENINSFFDIGDFLEKDRVNVRPVQISALLNTTLCYQKLSQWRDLVIVADKIIKYEPYNFKAIYRKCLSLKNTQEFDDSIAIIEKLLKDVETDAALQSKLDEATKTDFVNLLKETKNANAQYHKKQKDLYKSLFSSK